MYITGAKLAPYNAPDSTHMEIPLQVIIVYYLDEVNSFTDTSEL